MFGQFARRKRKEAGLSQDKVAQALGFRHRSEISRLEAGKFEWKLGQIITLSRLLGVTASGLLAEWEQTYDSGPVEAIAKAPKAP